MNDELHPCRKCGETQVIRDSEEDTGFCDGCAQDMIEDLVEFAEFVRNFEGFDENNCAMDEREMRALFQARAEEVLEKFGLYT